MSFAMLPPERKVGRQQRYAEGEKVMTSNRLFSLAAKPLGHESEERRIAERS
jgi:hypothetical protein